MGTVGASKPLLFKAAGASIHTFLQHFLKFQKEKKLVFFKGKKDLSTHASKFLTLPLGLWGN